MNLKETLKNGFGEIKVPRGRKEISLLEISLHNGILSHTLKIYKCFKKTN